MTPPDAHTSPGAGMHYLAVDDRFGTPIYVFLEEDPRGESGFPELRVREVTLGPDAGSAVGRDPARLDLFRWFRSDVAVNGAGFILIEPRYIGPCWASYLLAFRPGGEKPAKRTRRTRA